MQGPVCPGWILEPETPTLLLHLGGSFPDQLCLTWSALWCPPPTLQSHGVRLGMSAQAMQQLGHCWPVCLPGTQLKTVPGSLIYGVTTLEGAPALLGLFIV